MLYSALLSLALLVVGACGARGPSSITLHGGGGLAASPAERGVDLGPGPPPRLRLDGGLLRGASKVGAGRVTPPAYDEIEALRAAYYSAAAYCPAPAVSSWTCGPCTAAASPSAPLTRVVFLQNDTTEIDGYAGVDSAGGVVVAFRGSETTLNWLEDFDALPANVSGCVGCELHSGFLGAFESLSTQLDAALAALSSNASTPVLVTGHSLGASIAEIAAYFLQRRGVNVSITTFGTPRCGNAAWAAAWAAALPVAWRVIHAADPVPHLPPLVLGYVHAPREVWYEGSSYTVCSANDGEDAMCSDSKIELVPSDHNTYMGIEIDHCV